MKVIGSNVAIKPIKEDVKTDSGLLLSGSDVQGMRYAKGEIIQSGTDVPDEIKKGDVIYYDTRQSYTLLIKGEQVTMILYRDVVVVL
jgi:co-chaperonin GroES (HSP10)